MEKFKVVDINNFDRADYFRYFMSMGTTIELTTKIDVTDAVKNCKRDILHFQAYLLFKLYQTINTIDNFKYDMLDGKLIIWEKIVPTFSSFNPTSKLFFTLYADMKEDFSDFNIEYIKTVEKYKKTTTILPQGALPANVFHVSCLPWLHFDHFSSNSKVMVNQIVKMFTFGKYAKIDEKFMLPFTIQVSHAIVDGYHVSLLFETLQSELHCI